MKTHAHYSYYLLGKITGLEKINEYASYHHERMDGSGYPFQMEGKDLPEGSRIIAIADVFTTITEDRPYRRGMKDAKALQIIENMGWKSKLDSEMISLVKENYDEINFARRNVQEQAAIEYGNFGKGILQVGSLYS